LVDGSVSGPAIENENFIFIKKFISNYCDRDHITLENLLEGREKVILQLDIEGGEYQILDKDSIRFMSNRVKIIIIEMHFLESFLTVSRIFVSSPSSAQL